MSYISQFIGVDNILIVGSLILKHFKMSISESFVKLFSYSACSFSSIFNNPFKFILIINDSLYVHSTSRNFVWLKLAVVRDIPRVSLFQKQKKQIFKPLVISSWNYIFRNIMPSFSNPFSAPVTGKLR